jgi:hypothetical protein
MAERKAFEGGESAGGSSDADDGEMLSRRSEFRCRRAGFGVGFNNGEFGSLFKSAGWHPPLRDSFVFSHVACGLMEEYTLIGCLR